MRTTAQRAAMIGKRIRLDRTTDTYTRNRPGDTGTVTDIDDAGTVFVDWDNGGTLGLIESDGDRFTVLTDTDPTPAHGTPRHNPRHVRYWCQWCSECGREFDLENPADAQAFYYGHDCE